MNVILHSNCCFSPLAIDKNIQFYLYIVFSKSLKYVRLRNIKVVNDRRFLTFCAVNTSRLLEVRKTCRKETIELPSIHTGQGK